MENMVIHLLDILQKEVVRECINLLFTENLLNKAFFSNDSRMSEKNAKTFIIMIMIIYLVKRRKRGHEI